MHYLVKRLTLRLIKSDKNYRSYYINIGSAMLISWMVTLSSYLIWQIICIILPPNEYVCVYASLSRPAIDLQKMLILAKKKSSFQMKLILIWYVNKQNCHIWGTENPHAYTEKPTHPKRVTVWCGFWFRGIIGPFFFENE